jgi:hypothetical protein
MDETKEQPGQGRVNFPQQMRTIKEERPGDKILKNGF